MRTLSLVTCFCDGYDLDDKLEALGSFLQNASPLEKLTLSDCMTWQGINQLWHTWRRQHTLHAPPPPTSPLRRHTPCLSVRHTSSTTRCSHATCFGDMPSGQGNGLFHERMSPLYGHHLNDQMSCAAGANQSAIPLGGMARYSAGKDSGNIGATRTDSRALYVEGLPSNCTKREVIFFAPFLVSIR